MAKFWTISFAGFLLDCKVVSLISCNCRFSMHQTGTQECAPSISDPLSYTNALAGEEKSSGAIWKGNHQHEAVHGGQHLSAPLSMQRTLECQLARFAKRIPVLEHNHMVKTQNTTWRDGILAGAVFQTPAIWRHCPRVSLDCSEYVGNLLRSTE